MIILASTSTARRRMLEAAGIEHQPMRPRVDEAAAKARAVGLGPSALAQHLAATKAKSLQSVHPEALIIGCDQVLSCDGRHFDKPQSVDEALEHLMFLQGKAHILHTALCCIEPKQAIHHIITEPNLTMRALSKPYLRHYLSEAGPDILHCVGCYQIEGLGAQLFDAIDGDLFSIQGLPLLPLLAHLRTRGHVPS
jgi:septum formation protein